MPPPAEIVWWNSKEGKKRLTESAYANDFYALAHLFERQIKPTYCGIASGVMVLNALRLRKKGLTLETRLDVRLPEGKRMPFNCYTQITFFNPDIPQPKGRKQVEGSNRDEFDLGFTLQELARRLSSYLLDVRAVSVKDDDERCLNRFRQDLMAHLNESATFLIANYEKSILDHDGSGHFSPLAGYHPPTDSCLVMDVAGHKNPWFWVPLELLHRAMHTRDRTNEYRGYLVVSDKLDRL